MSNEQDGKAMEEAAGQGRMRWVDRVLAAGPRKWGRWFLWIGVVVFLLAGAGSFILLAPIFWLSNCLGPSAIGFLVTLKLSALIGLGLASPWFVNGLVFLVVHRLTKGRGEFWAPLGSEQVRDICEHLTDKEKTTVRRWGALTGSLMGLLCGAIIGLSVLSVLWSALLGAASLMVFVSWARTKAKCFLCSTQYAREQGIRPEDLRLYRRLFR